MEYKNDFLDLLKITDENFIGFGNPNASILIIGKETSDSDDKFSFRKNNRTDWLYNVDRKYGYEELKKEVDEEHKMFFNPLFPYYDLNMHFKLRGKTLSSNAGINDHTTSRTWYMYQKLVDLIYDMPVRNKNDRLDFFEKTFITELSDVSSKNSNEADAELRKFSVENRVGKSFLKHTFFQKFPIVIMAVGSYVGRRDFKVVPQEIFNVGDPVEERTNKDKFEIYRGDNSRMVIHSRQLSSYVSNDLLNKMADVVKCQL